MADDTYSESTEPGADSSTGMPDDLRELLDRAERDLEDSDVPVYDPNAEDEAGLDGDEDETGGDDDEELGLAEDDERGGGDETDIHGGTLQMREGGRL